GWGGGGWPSPGVILFTAPTGGRAGAITAGGEPRAARSRKAHAGGGGDPRRPRHFPATASWWKATVSTRHMNVDSWNQTPGPGRVPVTAGPRPPGGRGGGGGGGPRPPRGRRPGPA